MDALLATLFPEDGENTYAVIDGASCEELLDKIGEFSPEYFCLYAGEIEPDVAEVAPYLVALKAGHPFTEWFLANGLGRHWGIFARSPADLRTLRRHFRGFLMVRDPEGKQLYFRYYDPRVLRVYLPTCNPEETRYIFGPVMTLLTEGEDATVAISWKHEAGTINSTRVSVQD